MRPMSQTEINAILANPISTLTVRDIRRIREALDTFSAAYSGDSVTMATLAALFPAY